ncbi:anti-sigma factor [Bacillus sp. H-16]|uniref:anti-sigma factor n=1 Tax=Alteribacter salitolerans TaxID=2912333 RepID=UPI0019640413|nr:anti-sigma factor [Alteribacter salitolerans]MBM7095185.1 anti-sigma factor [Alteribacter salitolerans]
MNTSQCDRLIDYFNRQLSENEQKQFESHLSSCEDCREELMELRELTDELPFLADPVKPPENMKKRVLANVFANEEKNVREEGEDNKEKNNDLVAGPGTSRRKSPILLGSLAASLLLSVGLNTWLWTENRELAGENEQLAGEFQQVAEERNELVTELTAIRDALDEETAPGTAQVVLSAGLDSTLGEASNGFATLITEQDKVQLVIQVSDMPELSGTEAYQAWIIEGETPIPAGSFKIDETGNGAVAFNMQDLEELNVDQIAITLEPRPNNELPEGEILLASSGQ